LGKGKEKGLLMELNSKIYIAGNTGLVGSSLVRKFKSEGYTNLIFTPWPEFDLRNQKQVEDFYKANKPEYVFIAAAKVGGIHANEAYPAEFIYDNLMIELNLIHFAYKYNVKKLLFLGSSCIYPKFAKQPISENELLTGSLEPTNEPYAIAKISGLKMCDYYRKQYGCDFISVMPTNLYGPNDNYNLETSHVLPAIIRKLHLAKLLANKDIGGIRKDLQLKPFSSNINYDLDCSNEEIIILLMKFGIHIDTDTKSHEVILTLWGSGSPYREFLYVDELAEALLFLMENYSDYGHVNVGSGKDLTIKELAEIAKIIVGFNGRLDWDTSKSDGTPRKLLNIEKLYKLGWSCNISLSEGINLVYKNYSEYK
jgi:GDP-L-fucose synthase